MTADVVSVLHASLNGLMDRQRVIADNIANVATPGYLAKTFDFESALRSAIDTGSLVPEDGATVGTSNAPTNQDRNNVDLGAETVGAADTSLQYQAVTEALTAKFQLLRTAMS